MKTFGRYLVYRLNSSALRTLVFTLLSVLLTQSVIIDELQYTEIEYTESGIYMLAVILGIFCSIMPILELSGYKNRRNLDTLYFFPIKREKLALAHYLSGFIQVFAIYSVTFFVAYAYLAANTDIFALGYMMIYYVLSLLLGLVMYSVFMFIFIQANTVADGVLFCGLWIFVLFLVGWVLRTEILDSFITYHDHYPTSIGGIENWGILYSPINNLTVIFQDLIETNRIGSDVYAGMYKRQSYMFFIWGVLGIAAAVGYFLTFEKRGAEKAGEISDSRFGYRTLIPTYGYSLLMLMGLYDGFMIVLILAMMVIGYIIYRRGFKFKTSDMVVVGCGILAYLMGIVI